MNMLAVFAIFLVSASIILVCLESLKMRVARNCFFALTFLLMQYIPLAILGSDFAFFCSQFQSNGLLRSLFVFFGHSIDISNLAFASVTIVFAVVALLSSVACIIVVVETACAICKLVAKIKNAKQQVPKHHGKASRQPRLVHTKIHYKYILYLHFCRLNS